jgi:hypothetical protein
MIALEKGRTMKDPTIELERERRRIALKLEQTTKEAMIQAGCDFLKMQTDNIDTQTMVEITTNLETRLFHSDDNKSETAPKEEAPPKPRQFPRLEIRPHKLSFATYDGKEDPLPRLNRCEQFFKGQWTPDSENTWYASYHLTGIAQQWYLRLS